MKRTEASEKATKAFMVEGLGLKGGEERWREIFDLTEAAILLYLEEWNGVGPKRHKPSGWRWPFNEVARADAGARFGGDGSQPWTVLLREAYRLARPGPHALKGGA